MKYCEEYAALLDSFVDGELPVQETDAVRAHLSVCPGCQAYVQAALAIRDGFPDAEDTVLPADFAEHVMTAVRAAEVPRLPKTAQFRPGRWKKALLPLAACCAVVVLVRTLPPLSRPEGVPPTVNTALADTAETAPQQDSAESAPTPFVASPAPAPASEPAPEEPSAKTTVPAPAQYGVGDLPPGAGEIAPRSVLPSEDAAAAPFAILYLTAEQAALLPPDRATVDSAGLPCHRLSATEYDALLTALTESGDTPEPAEFDAALQSAPESYALVYVTEP